MKIKVWWIVSFCLLILGVYSYASISNLDNSISSLNNSIFNLNDLVNNNKFSDSANKVTDSTILILIKDINQATINQAVGSIYVDENGKMYAKATAFSIGDGIILTASHVINGINPSQIILVWNGTEYSNSIISMKADTSKDLALLKTNLTIPSVKFISVEKANIGSKIGFIGYPLNEKTPMLSDGIISSVRNEAYGFFWYTINAFVNRGNSGGPVFLADTGEVIGIIRSRQNEGIAIPQTDMNKLTEGEKQLMQFQIFIAGQLASNSQVGIGQIIGLNQRIIDTNIK